MDDTTDPKPEFPAPLEPSEATESGLPAALDFMRSVWAVDRALQELSRVMGLRLGITGPRRLILRVVGIRPGISPKALAAVLRLDPSTLTGHLQQLEDDGLVRRELVPEDARRQRVHLTAAGRKIDSKMPGTVEAAVEETLSAHDDHALDATRRVLAALTRALRAEADKCSPLKPVRSSARSTRRGRR